MNLFVSKATCCRRIIAFCSEELTRSFSFQRRLSPRRRKNGSQIIASCNTPAAPCSPTSYGLACLGVSASIIFANFGAAYGTAKAGAGIGGMGVMRGDLVTRSLIPVVMAGVLGIYGLIASVIINGKAKSGMTSDFQAYQLLSAGLTVGWFSGGTFFVN